MNWLYDHLRALPRYSPLILCDALANREEFPKLETWLLKPQTVPRRVWRRVTGNRLLPWEMWRIKRTVPYLLHSHFGYVAVDDWSLVRALNIPWVISFYGADVYQLGRQEAWKRKYSFLFSQATLVLALGPVMARALVQLGCPEEKIAIHPLGVDIHTIPYVVRRRNRRDPLRLLFAGSFREKKGIHYTIEALAYARNKGSNVRLDLVGEARGKLGDDETQQQVFRQIAELGIEDRVTYHPMLPFRELLELALRCHVFVAPSVVAEDGDAEGTPFVLQQMMATSMPVIATVHSDIPYLFGNHQDFLVPERDADAVAARIQKYVDNPEVLSHDGLILRELICQRFDVTRCAAHLSDLYDSIGVQRSDTSAKHEKRTFEHYAAVV